jgi:hypothetical protein
MLGNLNFVIVDNVEAEACRSLPRPPIETSTRTIYSRFPIIRV